MFKTDLKSFEPSFSAYSNIPAAFAPAVNRRPSIRLTVNTYSSEQFT